jgi:putative DNA primase/helicase
LAILPDARFSGRADTVMPAIETLLSVIGEDSLTINRKYLDVIEARLKVRFAIATNDLPRLADASGALARRLIIVRFVESFEGREDSKLEQRLLSELPGIFAWSLDGLTALGGGKLLQPANGADDVNEFKSLGSPVRAFVNERCVLDPTGTIDTQELFREFRQWANDQGESHVSGQRMFGRDLLSMSAKIKKRRIPRRSYAFYEGIRLRTISDDSA